jgi:hypothetical protein
MSELDGMGNKTFCVAVEQNLATSSPEKQEAVRLLSRAETTESYINRVTGRVRFFSHQFSRLVELIRTRLNIIIIDGFFKWRICCEFTEPAENYSRKKRTSLTPL